MVKIRPRFRAGVDRIAKFKQELFGMREGYGRAKNFYGISILGE